MKELRTYIRNIITEALNTSFTYDDSGARTSAANDLILFVANTPLCLEFARKRGTSMEDMKAVFNFSVQRYHQELKQSLFEANADNEDGSDDPETVMFDFFANYPTHYIFPEESIKKPAI